MKKTTLFLALLFLVIGTAKADFNQTWSAGNSSAWGVDLTEMPAGVSNLAGSNNVKCLSTEVVATAATAVEVGFTYTSGSCALNVIGVDLVDAEGTVVAFKYEHKHAGGDKAEEVFALGNVAAGIYNLRYFVFYSDSERLNDSNGNIRVTGLDEYNPTFTQRYLKHSTHFWDAGENLTETCPTAVKDLRKNESHVVRGALTAISVAAAKDVTITFQHNGGDHAMKILGVDVINNESEVVRSDYHFGSTGNSNNENVYTLSEVPAGNYTLRYFVCDGNDNDHNLENAQGNVTVMGAKLRATTLTATLTNAIGNFVFTYEGVPGTEPTITGASGHTLSSKSFDKNYFTAAITFPFPVSSAEVTNETMIASFANASYKWYADGTNISTKKNVEPSVYEISSYQWAIYPEFNEGAFTFTIKNVGTGKYVYSESNSNSHDAGVVFLEEEGSALTVEANNRFKLATGKYLSLHSKDGADGKQQYVGTWSGHGGCNTSFPELTAYTVTITSAKAATLTTPFAVSLPDGVKAGYVSGVNTDTKVLTYTDVVTTIPANGSVVLFGEEGTYTFNKVDNADAFEYYNYLVGYTVVTDILEGQTVYALGNKTNGVAFYKFGGTQYAACKAYLHLPEADAQAIGYFNVFGGEGTTGIENTEVATQNSVVIFDLMGRRVETMTEGNIYIVNGKKIIR